MQNSIVTFQKNIDALNALKSDLERAANEAAQQGGPLMRDSQENP